MKNQIKNQMKKQIKYIGAVITAAAVISMTACGAQQAAPAESAAATEAAKETAKAAETAKQAETAKAAEAATQAATEAAKETQAEQKVGMANPMVEINDSNEFEKQLGIKIDASKLHTKPKMFIIDGKVADIIMEMTNVDNQPVEYRLRATKNADIAPTMHGIYDELKDIGTIDQEFNGTKVSINQKETKDGKTSVHTWKVGDVYYSLVINNSHSQMQYAEVMDSIFMAIGLDPTAQGNK